MGKKTRKLEWNFPLYKGRYVYRDVSLDLRDLKKLTRISAKLHELYYAGVITRTGYVEDLKTINRSLERIIKTYDEEFLNHSVATEKS